MIERFQGRKGRDCLVDALCLQKVVNGDRDLALEIQKVARLFEIEKDDVLITQDHEDRDVYFILTGCLRIEINRRLIAERTAGTHVGEMALIDSKSKRCATVKANEKSVVAKLTASAFTKLANLHPVLWQRLALELCERLRNRNTMVRQRNEIPNVFICSSKENILIANAIKKKFKGHPVAVKVWTDKVFGPMEYTMDDLEREVWLADFAIGVVMDEDVVRARKQEWKAPRDNVIFELGLFMGQLGRRRSIIVSPHKVKIKLPSDLLGLTQLNFVMPSDAKNQSQLSAAMQPVGESLMELFEKLQTR